MKKAAMLLIMMVPFLFAPPLCHAGEEGDVGFKIFVKGQDQIYAFTMDIIRSVQECRYFVALNHGKEVHPTDPNDISSGIEKLESARSRMINWIDSREDDVSNVAQSFSNALDDLISYYKLVPKLHKEKKISLAGLATNKRKTGYEKIRAATPLIVRIFFSGDKAKPGLSKERLRLMLQFCKDTFKSELVEIEKRPAAVMEEPFMSSIFFLKLSLEEAIKEVK